MILRLYTILIFSSLFSCTIEQDKTQSSVIKVDTITSAPILSIDTVPVSETITELPEPPEPPESPMLVTPSTPSEDPDIIRKIPHIVIAKSGLFLRKSPGRKGEVVTKLPYFSELEVLSTKSFLSEEVLIEGRRNRSNNDVKFRGDWVKVKYKNLEGYVHNAYLIYKRGEYARQKKILYQEIDFALPGSSCSFNFHPNPNLQWYGIYSKESGYERVPIALEYQIWPGNNMTPILTLVDSSDNLLFCFATDYTLGRGPVEGSQEYIGLMENYDANLKELGITYKPIEAEEGNHYTIHKNGIHQLLNTDQIESEYNYITTIDWVGDIDEDGMQDYVITYGIKGGRTILYLSSEAKAEQVVAPVAIYLRDYCC